MFGPGVLRLQEELDDIVAAGKSRVVLNLSNVSEMDSEGLGTLMFASAKLREGNGGLALVNLTPSHIEDLMAASPIAASELLREVFEHEQDAINSLFPDRRAQPYDILEYLRSTRRAR